MNYISGYQQNVHYSTASVEPDSCQHTFARGYGELCDVWHCVRL